MKEKGVRRVAWVPRKLDQEIENIRKKIGYTRSGFYRYALTRLLEQTLLSKRKEIHLKPWQEAIGTYKTLETNENEVTLTLQRTPTNMKISFPKNSTEANILTKTLQNTPKNTKITILLTDNPQKPLIIKTFNEPTVTRKNILPLLWLRKRASLVLRCVSFFEGGH